MDLTLLRSGVQLSLSLGNPVASVIDRLLFDDFIYTGKLFSLNDWSSTEPCTIHTKL